MVENKSYGSLVDHYNGLSRINGRRSKADYIYLFSFAVALSALSAVLLFAGNLGQNVTVLEEPGYVDWLKSLHGPVGKDVSYDSSVNAILPAALPTTSSAGKLQGVDFAAETFPLDEDFVKSDPPLGFYVSQAICKFSGCYGGGNPQAYTAGPLDADEQEPDLRSNVLCTGVPPSVSDGALASAVSNFSPSSVKLLRSRRDGNGNLFAVLAFPDPPSARRAARSLDGNSPFGAAAQLYCVPLDGRIAATLSSPPADDGPPPVQVPTKTTASGCKTRKLSARHKTISHSVICPFAIFPSLPAPFRHPSPPPTSPTCCGRGARVYARVRIASARACACLRMLHARLSMRVFACCRCRARV